MEVENITRRTDPYPTFMPLQTVEAEAEDLFKDTFPHLFIVQGQKHLPELEAILSKANWSIRRIELQYDRWLLFCEPAKSAAPNN
jgi:hypothetical protein